MTTATLEKLQHVDVQSLETQVKDIVMAVKEGGPDPDANSRLRAVIQNAKSVNMPKDNIERAIKRASDKNQGDYKEVIYKLLRIPKSL